MKAGEEENVLSRAIRDSVAKVWAEVLERDTIGKKENFFDLGGDSLKALEIISRLHASLGVELPLIAFFEDPTIEHLSKIIAELQPTAPTPKNGSGTLSEENARATIVKVWSEVLQRDTVGDNENFFDLGGDSLKALEVISRLQDLLKAEVPLIAFFEDPTVAHLAEVVEEILGAQAAPVSAAQPPAETNEAPLSFGQLQYWLLQQSATSGHLHSNARVFRIRGEFDVEILKRALNELCRRQQVLGSRIRPGVDEPVQVLEANPEVSVAFDDLSSCPANEREAQALEIAQQEWRKLVDLSKELPLRARVLRLAENDHLLIIIVHHVVSDGHTGGIFFEELGAIYDGLLQGTKPSLPELPLQYFDYAISERSRIRGERLEKQLEFWRAYLEGAPAHATLPTDKPRPKKTGNAGSRTSLVVPSATLERLKEVSQTTGSTLFSILLGSLRILLYQWAGERDTVIGTVSSTRSRAGTERMIGCFVNFLPLRNQVGENETALDVLEREKRSVRDAFAHQDCPFLKIVTSVAASRITDANPVYNVGLLLQNFPEIKFSGEKFTGELIELESGFALLDLRFIATECPHGLQLDCEFNSELFTAATAESLVAALGEILNALAESPSRAISEFTIPDRLAKQAEAARRSEQPCTVAITSTFTSELVGPPLAFWMEQFGVPAKLRFAPYNQVFQQLLDRVSLLSSNRDGFNVVLLRLTDWLRHETGLAEAGQREKIEDNVRDLISALQAHPPEVPTLLCLCPVEEKYQGPQWAGFLTNIEDEIRSAFASLSSVLLVTSAEIFNEYPVENYADEYTDKLGHVPYTPDFFAALATVLARRMHAASSAAKKVIVLDGDGLLWQDSQRTITRDSRRAVQQFLLTQFEERGMLLSLCSAKPDEEIDNLIESDPDMPLRPEYILGRKAGLRSYARGIRELADELQFSPDEFIFVSADPGHCREVESQLPQVLSLGLPNDADQIPSYLKHVWAFDQNSPAAFPRFVAAERILARIAAERRDVSSIRHAVEAAQLSERKQVAEFVAPRTPAEEMIAGVWAQVLKLDRVGVYDNFFALGGHSLLATQVVARVRQILGIEIPLRTMFEASTVAEFSERVEGVRKSAGETRTASIPKLTNRENLPLSFAQQRLWFLDQLDPGNPLYNMAQMMRLRGKLDVGSLRSALNAMAERHEALRTTFAVRNSDPVQVIAEQLHFELPITDLSNVLSERREHEVHRLTQEEAQRPFDLGTGPLMRAQLLRVAEEDHVLLLTMHHIVSDRWTLGLVAEELTAHYRALTENRPASVPELKIQYADFAVWQRNWLQGDVLREQLEYWKKQLVGAPEALQFPTDHVRPAQMAMRGAQHAHVLPRDLVRKLELLSQQEGVTLFMTLLAAFEVLLARYSGQDDIVVGSPIAGRNFAELEPLIGFFVNTLALRGNVSGEQSFRDLLQRTKETCLQAYASQEIPFEKLVEELQPERSLSRNPIFQVMFALQNAPMQTLQLPGLELERAAVHPGTSILDMSWFAIEVPDGLLMRVEYSTELFEHSTIARAVEHFATLLETIVASPQQRISQLQLLSPAEKQRLLVEFNATEAEFPTGLRLQDFFEQSATRTPNATALVCGTQRLSYAELNARANQIANHLIKLSAKPEVLIGIFMERTPDLLAAILGVLKSGAAYVPIDPGYPKDRVNAILEDAKAPIVLTQQSLVAELAGAHGRVIAIDTDWTQIAAESRDNPRVEVRPNNLAYVLFTSGSTGRPKGVAIEHHSAATLVQWAQTVYTREELAGVLLSTSVCFDLSIFEIFVPFSVGGEIVLVQNALYLPSAKAKDEVTLINTVPSAIAELVNMHAVPASVKVVNLAGEALPQALVEEIYASTSAKKVFNLYGPTEDTTYSTFTLVPRGDAVTIGKPLPNSQAYVLDANQNLQPVGVPGELYLAGEGLARGYFGRNDLTAERFVTNPFAEKSKNNARMYRTGDLCRWLPNGQLEYLGRIDHQVKLRGFRIELGEIESVLLKHASVRQTLVMAREDAPGRKQLVAYIVPASAQGVDEEELRAHLKQSLPEFMIPAAFVSLEAFPLSPNGKINRKALPAPEYKASIEGYLAPRTAIEEVVAGIWAEVLRLPQVGVNDEFFSLGGHSLLATQVVSRVRQACRVELPLRALFEAPTVAGLAAAIEKLSKDDVETKAPPMVRVSRDQELPLAFAQQRLWFLDQLEPENPFYNIPQGLRMHGELNRGALEKSLTEIVRRHEVLRTTYKLVDGRAVQFISPAPTLNIQSMDLTHLPEAEREPEARRFAAEEARRPFRIDQGPVMRAYLLQLGEHEHILILNTHHIASDGWSMAIYVRELGELYSALVEGKPSPLPELPIQYADFALWQRNWMQGDTLERHMTYWRKQLDGAPATLELPADRPRPAMQTFRGETRSVRLPIEIRDGLKKLSQREGATLYMTLLAAFQTLLFRYTGQEDIVVGSPIANRNRAETENLIGFFVNALTMRTKLSGSPTFRELLGRVREVALDAYAHQDLPFEKLVEEFDPERSLGQNPLFQVLFVLQNAPKAKLDLPGLKLEWLEVYSGTAKFDIALHVAERFDGLNCMMEFNTDLFDAATIVRMLGHFQTLLEAVVAEPDQQIASLPILPPGEKQKLLVEFNHAGVSFAPEHCIHDFVEAQAARTPNNVAVAFENQRLTYRELNQRANQLAHFLRKNGVGPETLVGMCMDRSLEMVVGIIGILKAGGAYLPFDIAYPPERLAFMIEDAKPPIVLTQERMKDQLPSHGARIVCMDTDWPAIAHESTENFASGVGPENLAYVIYTSGSTGKPKGCLVTHYNVVRLMQATQDWYNFGEHDVWTMFHSYAFDFSVWELWGALFYGGRVAVVPYLVSRSPEEFYKLLSDEGVTVLNQTPSSFRQLIQAEETLGVHKLALRYVVFGGEALDMQSLKPWFERHSDQTPKLINMYGITETTVHVTYRPLSLSDTSGGSVIGQPIPDLQLYILDQHRQPLPIGIPGEMYVGGAGVARGYLNRPELSAERFIPDPFTSRRGARLYKTGDLARYLANGDVEYLGRIDHQVKIRGFRIELGEIESVIAEHPAIRNSVVLVREDEPGNKQLVAYVVADKQYQGEAEQSDATAGLKEEQVSQWEMTFDETYSQGSDEDPEFNIVGWNSSYTGQPYPAGHMREWVDATVDRIRALKPKKILEIGCGTGLLLLRTAPECEQYLATDFSQKAISRLERITRQRGMSQVSLLARMGDNFEGIEPNSFDCAVINSVIQYFPSIDYLMTVIEGMVKAVAPGGKIFIGDVRTLPLLEAFHAAVQLQQAPNSLPADQLAQRIRQRVAQDEELVIDPGLFHELKRREPKLGRVEIQIKRGRHRNEMTQFRYDAVLHVGAETHAPLDCTWIDWQKQNLNVQAVSKLLQETAPDLIGISGVRNARVAEELTALRLLGRNRRPANVEQLKNAIRQENIGAVEPEDIWGLADSLGYRADINWSVTGYNAMDVVFRRESANAISAAVATPMQQQKAASKPWSFYANNPLSGKIIRNLVPQLRQRASDKLPEYMVPSAFVVLDSLPLTENGKVDRKALPAPDQLRPELEGNYVAPRTPAEELLAGIWAEVLKLERVGIHDDFFDLGGHSLNATQVVSRVREAFKVEMPLRAIFESPTVEKLAGAIAALKRHDVGSDVPPMVAVGRNQEIPLSFAQQRLWFLDQLDPANPLYNVPRAIRLTGNLHYTALVKALTGLVARHEILRTTYHVAGDHPVQVISPHIEFDLPIIDLSALSETERESQAQRVVSEEANKGFNLDSDPILRGKLLNLGENDHVLFLNTHHIASDGWSTGVMINDLCALYEAALEAKDAALPELAIQYADYASWQRNWLKGEVLEKQLAYWKKTLEGAPPVLSLPTDRPRPEIQTFNGATFEAIIPKNIVEELRALGRRQGATPFMSMLSAFECLLHYYTQQKDIVIGTDLANRMTVETEALIGFFVNLLVLRTDLSGDPTFAELTARVREVSLSAYAHQDLPFDKLVEELRPERNLSHSPLVQVLFVQQNTPRSSATMPGLEMSRFRLEVQSKFDMAVFMRETGNEVASSWVYNPDLFETGTIARMSANFEAVLHAAIAQPQMRLSAICEMLAQRDKDERGSEQQKFQHAGLQKLRQIRRKREAAGSD